MPKEKVPFEALKPYLPENSFEEVMLYLVKYKVQLTVARQRQSILGDYRHAHAGKNHRISVNGNLNPYSFLITLLHELAHLLTFETHGNRVQAHGAEWKNIFGSIISEFLQKNIFPDDVTNALTRSLHNPAASSCADEKLLRVLQRYDPPKEGVMLLEQLTTGNNFKIKGGRIFSKGEKIRKRYKCQEISTEKWYLFSPVYEVKAI
jgi:SprT protein